MKDGSESEAYLIQDNCVNADLNVLLSTQYAHKDQGHIFLFETFAFSDDAEHYLSCDVDICLRNRLGGNVWPQCHKPCVGPKGKFYD